MFSGFNTDSYSLEYWTKPGAEGRTVIGGNEDLASHKKANGFQLLFKQAVSLKNLPNDQAMDTISAFTKAFDKKLLDFLCEQGGPGNPL